MKHTVLAQQLEHSLMSAILAGMIAPSTLSAEELSKEGKTILKSVNHLMKHGAPTPLKLSAVRFIATKIFGAGRNVTRKYLKVLSRVNVEEDAQIIIKAARSKEALVNLINEASDQLAQGDFDRSKLNSLVGRETWAIGKLSSVADLIARGFPKAPRGLELSSLPAINNATHGFRKMWIVGGEPGTGKSCLAWQLSIELSSAVPVLYYDLDGTGIEDFVERTRIIFGGHRKKAKKAMKNIYHRENIEHLDNDLNLVKPPCMIVIDMMQSLPTMVNHRRNSLDKWLVQFKDISKRGYHFFIVSEVPRGSYGKVGMDSFKESGEIEYAGSLCARMLGDAEEDDEPIEFHILKNRHGKKHGHIINLERDPKKEWWFREARI